MSVEKTKKPVAAAIPTSKEDVARQKKEQRPNVIERLADLQRASDALENLRKGAQNIGVAEGHTDNHIDHNDAHTNHDNLPPHPKSR